MKVKYMTSSIYSHSIKKVEIERETEASVWIKGRRQVKSSGYHSFFNTFEEAKAHLLEEAQAKCNAAKKNYERQQKLVESIRNLKEVGKIASTKLN